MGTQPIPINTEPQVQQPNPEQAINWDTVFKNPAFNKLPVSQQRQLLGSSVPEFQQATDKQYYEFRKQKGYALDPSLDPVPIRSAKDKALDYIRPFADDLAGTVGAVASAPAGPMVAAGMGIGSSSAADMALQNLYDEPSASDLAGQVSHALGTTLANKAGGMLTGKLLNAGVNGVRALFTPGTNSAVDAGMEKFYNMYFGNTRVSQWVKNLVPLVPLGKGAIDPNLSADEIQKAVQGAYKVSDSKVDANQWLASQIAKSNVSPIISEYNPGQFVKPSASIPTGNMPPAPQYFRTVEGPINLNQTTSEAHDILKDTQQNFGDITSNNVEAPKKGDLPYVYAARNLLGISDAKPVNGGIDGYKSTNPINLNDALASYKILSGEDDPRAQKLAAGLKQDIMDSIPKWKNNGPQALATVQKFLASSDTHASTFGKDGLGPLLDNTNSPLGDVDRIVSDPKLLQKAINSGDVSVGGATIKSNNVKENLRGYMINKLFDNPAAASGTLSDPNMKSSLDKLFSGPELDRITSFTNNVKNSAPISGAKLAWLAPSGLIVGAELMHTHVPSYYVAGGLAVGAYKMGSVAISRLLANPKTAQVLEAAATGKPLGISTTAASKLINDTLQGATIYGINDKDGSQVTLTGNNDTSSK